MERLPDEFGEDGACAGLRPDGDFLGKRLRQIDGKVDNVRTCDGCQDIEMDRWSPFHLERPPRAGSDIRIKTMLPLVRCQRAKA